MISKTVLVRFSAAVCILLILFVGQGLGQETKLTWFGHAAFSLTTPRGKVLLIDPWLTNPANRMAQRQSQVCKRWNSRLNSNCAKSLFVK